MLTVETAFPSSLSFKIHLFISASISGQVLLPTPKALTKEERRLLFERKVLENDQKKALNKKQQFTEPSTLIDSTNNVLQNTNSDFSFISSESNYSNPKSECYSFPAPENTTVPFDQYYYNTNELQLGRPPLLPTPGPTSNTLNPESLLTTNPLNSGPLPITSNALNPGLLIANNALGALPITSTIVNPGTLPMIEKSNTIYSPNVYHSSHLQVPVLGPPPVSQPPNNLTPCQNNPTAPTNLMVINSSPIVPTLPAVNAEANISSSKEAVHSTLYAGVQNSACVSGPTSFPTSALFTPYVASQVPYAVNPNNGYYAQQQVTISVSEQAEYKLTEGQVTPATFDFNIMDIGCHLVVIKKRSSRKVIFASPGQPQHLCKMHICTARPEMRL
ncbi:uncharacterized protein TNCV_2056001 [Trichonephila clavipes]|nr:uncharacterized protein TNCV_2056001 [Trichonephila clavipes]